MTEEVEHSAVMNVLFCFVMLMYILFIFWDEPIYKTFVYLFVYLCLELISGLGNQDYNENVDPWIEFAKFRFDVIPLFGSGPVANFVVTQTENRVPVAPSRIFEVVHCEIKSHLEQYSSLQVICFNFF